MATPLASSFSSSLRPPPPNHNNSSSPKHDLSGLSLAFPFSTPPSTSLRVTISSNPRKFRPITLTLASSSSSHSASSSFDDFGSDTTTPHVGDKKSLLADLIREIEPLDVSLIQKDVPPMTLDAMKRTISGMLGLLPSDRFQVFIEALWKPLSKLLVSSMMTGYTLRNAEYRLCLERNLDIHEGDPAKQTPDDINLDLLGIAFDAAASSEDFGENVKSEICDEDPSNYDSIGGLGEMSPEAQQYILHLQSQLSSMKKQLHEVKRKSAALQMQQFVGEEKNDLLDYLRSLRPEKVAELSEPTSPELKETIHSVVHGLLATLSPKMHSKAPPQSENPSAGTLNIGIEDCTELVENTSLQFKPLISLTRDYLARLLFWCMLLGHYLRGLEYRMELMELLSLSSDVKNDSHGDGQVA